MKKIELSAQSLASLDLAIKQKKENFDITGDDVCDYIQVGVDVVDVIASVTEIFGAAVASPGERFLEKLYKTVNTAFKGATVEELIDLRAKAVARK